MPDQNGNWTNEDIVNSWKDPNAAGLAGSEWSPRAQFDPSWASDKAGAQIFGGLRGGLGGNMPSLRGINSAMQPGLLAGAQRTQAVNPYSAATADQSRAAQMALLAQMRAQQAGPSLAGLQGQRGMAQSGQQALAAAAMGGPARAAMMQAGQQGGGMAGDIGQARLAEVMRMQAGQGGLASGLRGNDLRSAEAQAQSGLRAQGIADQRAQFYAGLGSRGALAGSRVGLENDKLNWRIAQAGKETNAREANNYINLLATLFGGAFGGGK